MNAYQVRMVAGFEKASQDASLCQYARDEYRKIAEIIKEDPNAEPGYDYHDPCQGCLGRKEAYNDCPAGL